jgi:hypothetical protein
MSKQKCFPYNTEPCTIKESFPELPNRFPQYYLCQYKQRNSMNDAIDNRREAFVRNCNQVTRGENLGYEISPSSTWRVKQAPKDTFDRFTSEEMLTPDFVNLGGNGDKFYGFARNVDVESELFRINYLNDKCFDSEYKVNPNLPTTSLYKYRNVLNHTNNNEEICYDNFQIPKEVNLKNLTNPVLNDYLNAQHNTYRDLDLQPLKCLKGTVPNQQYQFSNYKNEHTYFQVGPGFDNKPEACFPPQQVWNTVTKRKMIFNRQFKK